jgi:hypothetical protein
MLQIHVRALLFTTVWLAAACGGDTPPPQHAQPATQTPARAVNGTAHPTTVAPALPATSPDAQAEPARDPVLLVTDREVLLALERAGADFGTLLVDRSEPGASNAELDASAAYRSIADVIRADVAAVARKDPQAGVGIRGHTHRLFDVRWLTASAARFELVAVVNRIDRRPFDASVCGETRLVYRLAYDAVEDGARLRSRLPMTLVAELHGPAPENDGSCRRAAQRWLAPAGLHGRALGAWLASPEGPLAPELLSRARLSQLAINVQTVRWPSGARPDLAGHAEYMLRAFAWDPARERYAPRALENTPDVPRLRRDRALREQLRAYIASADNLARIDAGTAVLPDQFLAQSVTSVTPRGLARLQNRPFRSLFAPRELAELPYAQLTQLKSPEALLRSLDGASCNGCHQSRSVAGFHLLGEDDAETAAGNALVSALSPHAQRDVPRRARYLRALLDGAPAQDARPLPERAGAGDNGYGAHCGLGDPGFAAWQCAPGLHCDAYEAASGEDTVGVCLPDAPRVGDPCEPGRVESFADPRRDRVRAAAPRACDYVCEAASVGFPGGMCASSCDALPADGACGGIAILTDFNACLARRTPFADCVARHVRPAGLRACSADEPCRDDYVCARTASGAGACLPPYFVFQLRVDGHP